MKKLLLSLAMMLSMTAFADNQLQLKGTITGMPAGCKISIYNNDGDIDVREYKPLAEIDATENFTITTALEGPTMLRFMVTTLNEQYNRQMPICSFDIMAGNENVEMAPISLDELKKLSQESMAEEKIVIKGSKISDQHKEYLDCILAENQALTKIYTEGRNILMKAAYGQLSEDNDSVKMYRQQIDELNTAKEMKTQMFINEHPEYAISALLVSRDLKPTYQLTAQEVDAKLALIEGNPDTHRMAVAKKNAENAKKHALLSAIGNEAVTMAEGTVKNLQSLLNRKGLTLIDCWASWCAPCRRAIPKIKTISEQYADKVKVVSISCDQKEPDWRKAMEEEKMPWPQAILNKEQNIAFTNAYDITTIPRLILVKDGKIVVSTANPADIEKYIKGM